MNVMKDFKYTRSHEWVRLEGDKAFIGITDYAQDHLGSIVFIELPEVDGQIIKSDSLAVVESVKAASDVYSPLTGTVSEVNESLLDEPEQINKKPYESWFVSLTISNAAELEDLLDAAEYETLCRQGE